MNKTLKHLRRLRKIVNSQDTRFEGIMEALRYDCIKTVKMADQRSKLLAPLSAAYILGAFIESGIIATLQPYGPNFVRDLNHGWHPKDPSKYNWDYGQKTWIPK